MNIFSGGSAYSIIPVIIIAYLLGCLNSAYYLTRFLRGTDIRSEFSHNAGATNAGRVLGSWAFVTVTGIDIIRGAAAVVLAAIFVPDHSAAGIALLAVVLGHIHPLQLGLRGGKGAAPLIGGALAISLLTALGVLALCALLYLTTHRKHLSAFIAFAAFPLALALQHYPPVIIIPTVLTIFLILLTYYRLRNADTTIDK